MNRGWECPRCGRVWNPSVVTCDCGPNASGARAAVLPPTPVVPDRLPFHSFGPHTIDDVPQLTRSPR